MRPAIHSRPHYWSVYSVPSWGLKMYEDSSLWIWTDRITWVGRQRRKTLYVLSNTFCNEYHLSLPEVTTDLLQNTSIHLCELHCSILCQNMFTAKAWMFTSYTPYKFNCNWAVMKGTFHKGLSTFSTVSRVSVDKFSWKYIPGTLNSQQSMKFNWNH